MIGLSLVIAAAAAASEPKLQLTGEWRQGNVILGRTAPGARVFFNAQAVRVSPQGQFVLGLDRDESPHAELRLVLPSGAEERHAFTVQVRTYAVQRIDGLPPDQVSPPLEMQPRIAEEARRVQAARQRDTARTDFTGGFIWPCRGPISGVFGSQRILNGTPKQPHYGVDVAVPSGTPVRAPAGGIVSLAAPDLYYTGGTLMIDHGHGLSSVFSHLSRLRVKPGQEVRQGDLVAEVGATGRATGPHLHWGVNWFDARVDAALLAGPMPTSGDGGRKSESGD
ncbi:MAG: M23 family metallopeptidase [Nevskiales bacterium]|nr:M23 family metallopeptidase [Nevskiales bacterium]